MEVKYTRFFIYKASKACGELDEGDFDTIDVDSEEEAWKEAEKRWGLDSSISEMDDDEECD